MVILLSPLPPALRARENHQRREIIPLMEDLTEILDDETDGDVNRGITRAQDMEAGTDPPVLMMDIALAGVTDEIVPVLETSPLNSDGEVVPGPGLRLTLVPEHSGLPELNLPSAGRNE